jgi:hypothetical protein
MSVEPLAESFRSDVLPFRPAATLFSLFAALALVLAAVGQYGILGDFVTELLRRCCSASRLATPWHSSMRLRSSYASRSWPRSCPRGAPHGSIR